VGNWRAGDQNSAGFGPGGAFMLRTFPARHAPLWASSYVARVRVSDLAADRNFLALVVRLRQLGDDPAVVGVLLDIEGLSSREAAQLLGISHNTVRSRHNLARDEFKRLWLDAQSRKEKLND